MSKQAPPISNVRAVLRLLSGAGVAVFAQDELLRYRWIENAPASWIGKTDSDILPAKAATHAAALKREVLQTGRARWGELVVEEGANSFFFDVFLEPDRDARGKIVGLLGLAIDVSSRRRQEATVDAISRDLSHRTKNLLAVIQSLGTQTARAAASTEDFIAQFRGRIQSISRSQDLSIGAKKHGASLSGLIESQVQPYVDDASRRIDFRGIDTNLTANGAMHIGLGLYELCINSAQFGALSVPGGKVVITSEIGRNPKSDGARHLEIVWQEEGGPPPKSLDGFSRTFLERIVPASVGGSANIVEEPGGRRYELFISETEFD